MKKRALLQQQLDSKMQAFAGLQQVAPPPAGWIRAVRTAIGMSLQQLGNRLSVTRQSVQSIERREKEGTVTVKALREAAAALDMQLVYGFVPRDGSLDALINRRARELAEEIVLRASQTMKLEDQENTARRIEAAIRERAAQIRQEMPRSLWD